MACLGGDELARWSSWPFMRGWVSVSIVPPTGIASPRERFLELVLTRPGLTTTEVRDALDIGWGSFYHHLEVLQKAGKVEAVGVGRRSLLYPTGAQPLTARQEAVLRGGTIRSVACAIRDQPGCGVRDIMRVTGQSGRVVYYHVGHLIELGLVTPGSRTRQHDLSASPLLVDILSRSIEAPPETRSE